MAFNIALFVINIAASYLLSRLTAPDGPRLKDLDATGGDYGVPMSRGYGEKIRAPGIFIAQADIEETKHKSGGGLLNTIGLGFVAGLIGPKYYTYSVPAMALLLLDRTNDDPIEGIEKLSANGKLIFKASESDIHSEHFGTDGKLVRRKYLKNKYFKSLALYTGHTEQFVDPILEEHLDEDGAYPFSALIVLEDFQLADFGNSIPSFEGLVQVKSDQTLADIAEAICAAAGIDHLRDISSTALVNNSARGYLIDKESTCWDALKPLMPVFGVDAAEVSGQIRFYRRSQSMRATIPTDDLGAHAFGDSPPEKFLFKRSPDLTLPQQTTLNFIDLGRNYQPNSAAAQRAEGNAQSNVSITLPLVLTADEAASATALMHWDAWLGRTELAFTLTDAWLGLEAGVAYGFPVAGEVVPYRVTRRARGANGIIEVNALSDESVSYTASVAGSSGTIPPDDSTLFADTRLILLDMSILEDDHDDYGFYIAVGDEADGWPRAIIQASTDGVTFEDIADVDESAVMGDVTGTLAAGTTTGLDDTLDTTSVLTVVLLHDGMQLESATDDELDEGKNLSFVGKDGLGEYLQFKTATFVSGSTWQLTNLRRGRRGTDFAISTHASGEEFVLVDSIGVFRVTQPLADWGDLRYFRGVTLHQDEADAAIVDFTNTGEGKRPYSPVNVEGAWDGSNNLTITWDSRSRLDVGGLGIDDNAEWDIEFFGGTGHSETVVAETATFSAAEQTAAGLTPGDTVTGRVRQTSDVNDGRWRDFEIIGPNALTFDTSLTFDETSFTWDAG